MALKHVHDLLRPTHSGTGSYAKAVSTLQRLVDAGVDIAAESVYTRTHFEAGITPQDIADHLVELGVREVQISPALGTWHSCDNLGFIDEVAELFEQASRNSIRSFRTSRPFLLRGIQFVIDGFALREKREHVCGAGRTFMAINYDGEAFPCYLLESPEIRYGFIDNRWDQNRYNAVRQKFECNGKSFHEVCRQCWANEICQSCLGSSFQIEPQVTKPPAWFCTFQKQFIGAVLAEIAAAIESDDYSVFMRNMQEHLLPLQSRETRNPFADSSNMVYPT